MIEALKCEKNIASDAKRSEFRISLAKKFDEEALLATLATDSSDHLVVDQIQEDAGRLIYSSQEEEIFESLGDYVPDGALDFVREVHRESQGLLTYQEKKRLPSPDYFKEKKKLGKGILSAFQSVIWSSLCDKDSEVYKMWFTNGMQAVLDKKYMTTAVVSALAGLNIGVYAIAVYLTALMLKIGIETFCKIYKPAGIMGLR